MEIKNVTNEEIAVMLGHIDEKLDRLVWRADQSELRQLDLDRRVTVLETINVTKKDSMGMKVVQNSGYIAMGILLTYIGKQLGLV